MTEYKTVLNRASGEFTERRSRFIGHAMPVKTEEEAIAFINELKAKYWDASHNVYAYTLRDGQIKRYSDDGEPQGTAGIPTLDVLLKSGVTDTVVVVTRYFGGVLLGAGGLVRAYSHGASLALEQAEIVTMRECLLAELSCDYNQYGRLQALVPECGGVVDDAQFTDQVKICFHITGEELERLQPRLADATCGTVTVTKIGKKFFRVF